MDILGVPRDSTFDVKWANTFRPHKKFSHRQHFNPNYELITVSEGPVYLQVGEEKYTLEAGETILLLPWEQHKGWRDTSERGEFYWVQFESSTPMNRIAASDLDPDLYNRTPGTNLPQVKGQTSDYLLLPRFIQVRQKFKLLSLYEELIAEMNDPHGNYLLRAQLILGSILELISTTLLQELHLDYPASKSYKLYCNTITLLNNFYMGHLNKPVVEQLLGHSYEHIGHVFKKYTGMTIVEYIQQLRLQRAKHLLTHSEKSLKAISEEIGYEDTFYFSKVFKKNEGLPPSHYREQTKQAKDHDHRQA